MTKTGRQFVVSSTVQLGDRQVTRIGLGTNRLTNTPVNREFLQAAVAETALNHIDSAHLYTAGESEQTIGAALSPFPSNLLVATKGGYDEGGGLEGFRAELEQSFERLQTDVIELYYQHRVHPDLSLEDALGVLNEYREAGRIRHIGISAVTVPEIDRARTVAPIAAVPNEYSIASRAHDDEVDYCAAEGIVFVPYFPLRGDHPPAVAAVAKAHGATTSQIRLAWLMRRSPTIVTIPGTLSLEHLRENLAALEIELSDAEFEQLSA
jgi:aryl-alcohol dehydrogenase-like predicted oxidoreductase